VLKELVRLQKNFLWGDGREGKKCVGLVGIVFVNQRIREGGHKRFGAL
jgi:hypothetical protein